MGFISFIKTKNKLKKCMGGVVPQIIMFSEGNSYRYTNMPVLEELIKSVKVIYITIDKNDDLIIAFGGGSIIDIAKCVSIIYESFLTKETSLENITEIITSKSYTKNKVIETIAIPTTAGTSSDLTKWATVWDYNNIQKYSMEHENMQPKKSIIIPELTLALPLSITLSTSLDSLSHSVEAYWAKHTNPIIQNIALKAITLIVGNLEKCLEKPKELIYREKLSQACMLSGLAFGQTRTTDCHSISYSLTMDYNIEHGIACAMTLPLVANLNYDYMNEPELLFSLFDGYAGMGNFIKKCASSISSLKLSDYGVKREDIKSIVSKSFSKGRNG